MLASRMSINSPRFSPLSSPMLSRQSSGKSQASSLTSSRSRLSWSSGVWITKSVGTPAGTARQRPVTPARARAPATPARRRAAAPATGACGGRG